MSDDENKKKEYVGIPCSIELRDTLKILVAQEKVKSYEELIWKLLEKVDGEE